MDIFEKMPNDNIKIDSMLVTLDYFEEFAPEVTKTLAFSLCTLARNLKDAKGEARGLIIIGHAHTLLNQADSALYYYNWGQEILERISDKKGLGSLWLRKGILFDIMEGQNDSASLQAFSNAEQWYRKAEDEDRGIAISLGEMDGISAVQHMQRHYDIPVVYMTANTDDHSFSLAKATNPFAFIEKPFRVRRLLRTFELLIQQVLASKEKALVEAPPSFLLKDRIFIKDKDKMVKIFLKDIFYIEAERAYCQIITAEKTFLLATPLGNLEKSIGADFLMRVHRSYIINLTQINELKENYVYIHQKYIPVSRSYWNEFMRRIKVI